MKLKHVPSIFLILFIIFASGCTVNRCNNECAEGEKVCSGEGYKICGNYDSYSCFEWSPINDCYNNKCINGECIGNYIPPNSYSKISGCEPFLGNNSNPLKIMFVNLGNASYYNELVSDVINNAFKRISPFKENFNYTAFYSISIAKDNITCGGGTVNSLSGSGFVCDNNEIYKKISEKCGIDDERGIIAVVIAESEQSGSGGDVIYLGTSINRSLEEQLALSNGTVIHEIGHNFGLADLYAGIFYYDGRPSQFWDTNFSRSFLNVDGPGCKKWCQSFKPPSEYVNSVSSECLKFSNKTDCVSFERDNTGSCNPGMPEVNCCVWSDEKFEYFGTNCVPAWGSEDIGINCLEGSGCYFGAVYGNYAWRPVLDGEQSIMYHTNAGKFDSVSENALNRVFECCLTDKSVTKDCQIFRKEYSDFLENTNFKKRIGSCGYSANKI